MGPILALAILMTPHHRTDNSERDAAIARAITATRAAMPTAEADPNRPTFHFHPPAMWMNDPNGPFFSNGWYHVFYQYHPYSDQWGPMYWGHARSRDLVNWEDLPPALWPSTSLGESGCWSGSTFFDGHGKPVIYYTSVGDHRPSQQWAAMPDDDSFITWHKAAANPMIEEGVHGMPAVGDWRDPFLFAEGGHTYLITGGGQNGHGAVFAYRATNAELTRWSYVGVLFHHPDADVHNIECPNFGRIGDRWVLLTSVHGRVEAFVGKLDDKSMSLQVEHRSVLAPGSYASQLLPGPDGRLIHFAWVQMSSHKGWNGCMTLPSILTLSPEGTLMRQPVPELAKLRTGSIQVPGDQIQGEEEVAIPEGSRLEVELEVASPAPIIVKLHGLEIKYDPATRMLLVPGRGPEELPRSNSLKLHLFLDGSILDVYAADGAVTECTQFTPSGDQGFSVASAGAMSRIRRLMIYPLKAADLDTSRFVVGGK
jgi:beta-fructofuranosidase